MSEHTLFELMRACMAVGLVVFTVSTIVLLIAITVSILIPGVKDWKAKQ